MLTRRVLAKLVGAAALSGGLPFGPATQAFAQGAAGPSRRGAYLIKNGAVVTVDAALGTLPRADVLVRDGRIAAIGPDLAAADAEVIDAADMIVMPGFVDTHYHMWSTLGRNFIADDGFGYFPAKNATSKLYNADDFYNSVMLGLVELANAGITTVHNWSHNTRTPAHADAELRAHRNRCCAPATPTVMSTRCRATRFSTSPISTASSGTSSLRARPSRGSSPSGSICAGCRKARSAPIIRTWPRHGARPAGRDSCEPVTAECRRRRGLREARIARPGAARSAITSRRARSTPRSWRAPTRR